MLEEQIGMNQFLYLFSCSNSIKKVENKVINYFHLFFVYLQLEFVNNEIKILVALMSHLLLPLQFNILVA